MALAHASGPPKKTRAAERAHARLRGASLIGVAAPRAQDRYYLTDAYMREVLEHMSIAQLIDTILINPTVHVAPSYRDTGLSATYTFQPLSNLVYTRDQQACAAAGRHSLRLGLHGGCPAPHRSARPVIGFGTGALAP